MNFLSHYYFERYATDSLQVLGSILPDVLKNVNKKYAIHIHKHEGQLDSFPEFNGLLYGWKNHIEVDRLFHNTPFFYYHTHQLRLIITPLIADLPIRATFLAHISLELLLDHLLIDKRLLSVERFYEYLGAINRSVLERYFKIIGTVDLEKFFTFYDQFLASKYIFEYSNIANLPKALFNICKRIWDFDVRPCHLEALTSALEKYKQTHLGNFQIVFSDIQQKLVF